jgi:hypothetical protein
MGRKFNGNIIAMYPDMIKAGDPIRIRLSWSAERLSWQIGWHTWIDATYNTRKASTGAPTHFGQSALIDLGDHGYNIINLGVMPNEVIRGTLELKAGLAFGAQSETLEVKDFIIYPAGYDGDEYTGDYVQAADPPDNDDPQDIIIQGLKYALYILIAGLIFYLATRLIK